MRRVRTDRSIECGGDLGFLRETLKGGPVRIAETYSGDWIVHFADIDLGIIVSVWPGCPCSAAVRSRSLW